MFDKLLESLIEGGPIAIVAGALLFLVYKLLDRMNNRAEKMEDTVVAIVKNNTSAMVSLRAALRDRPCLKDAEQLETITNGQEVE